jgi:two-component sensor histidine kinase
LNIDWRESDGPLVTPPTRRGFGTRLFLRALEQFGGKVEANFASTGLVCKWAIVLADGNPKIVPGLSGEKPNVFTAG